MLLKRIRNINIPIDLQVKLFDQTIVPVLTYASEIWGVEDVKILEKVQLDFLRTILCVRKSTPLFMLYGEVGQFPLQVIIQIRIICFWGRLLVGKASKLSLAVYKMLLKDTQTGFYNHKWIVTVRTILENCGMNNIWLNQSFLSLNVLKFRITSALKDQFIQSWRHDIANSSKGQLYLMLKEKFEMEQYLLIQNFGQRIVITKFRTVNHRLPIEKGRWENIPTELRICRLCNKGLIGDEFHYILVCEFFNESRKSYLSQVFWNSRNKYDLKKLLCSKNKIVLNRLSKFIKIILDSMR